MPHGNPPAPYALWIGGTGSDLAMIKPATGLVKWRPDDVVAEIADSGTEVTSGVRRLAAPSPLEAGHAKHLAVLLLSHGTKTLVNATSFGTFLPPDFVELACECLKLGISVASGSYVRLRDDARLRSVLFASPPSADLYDYRYTDEVTYPLATGARRRGLRLLTVGGDGALGKKYTALTMHRAMRRAGMSSTFCATGQTGRLLCSPDDRFVVLDALQADFVSGAAEWLTPDHDDPGHWYVVEGQGAPAHPAWCSCSTGLLLGTQPDRVVYCIEAGRRLMRRTTLPIKDPVEDAFWQSAAVRRSVNSRCRVLGFSVNNSVLRDPDLYGFLRAESDLPVFDPAESPGTDLQAMLDEMQALSVAARAAANENQG